MGTAPDFHSKRSPSSSSRWLQCPYSLTKDVPDLPSNDAADFGTEAHAYAAEVLNGDTRPEDVPKRHWSAIEDYVSYVNECPLTPIVETRFDSMEIPDFGGTVDCLLYDGSQLQVVDLKTGRHKVPVQNNPQLLSYALLASEHLSADKFFGAIVQPRAMRGKYIDCVEITERELDNHRLRILETVDSDRKRTGDHCRFCPLRFHGECEEGQHHARREGWKATP